MTSARIRPDSIDNTVVVKLKSKNGVAILAAIDGLDKARYPVLPLPKFLFLLHEKVGKSC
jgi:hypothetical protein